MAAPCKRMQTIFLWRNIFVLYFFILIQCQITVGNKDEPQLETIQSNEVDSLLKSSDFVVLYMTNDDCHACTQNLPVVQGALKTTLMQGLKAYQLKDKEIAAKYDIFSFPTILFFRKGIPLAYHSSSAEISGEELSMWLEQNREISTKTLSDADFEHLTQASTGATTGDWFVLFYKPSCQALLYTWEAVAARLKHKLNVAKVDTSTSPHLEKRFKTKDCPTIIFFRLGNMYRYSLSKLNAASLVNFAEGWYKNMKADKVQPPQSPFDEVVEALVENIRATVKDIKHTQIWHHLWGPKGVMYLSIAGGAAVIAFIITAACCVHGVKSKQE